MMTYENNKFRVVHDSDRATTVKTFATLKAAQNFTRSGYCYEIQRAVPDTEGGIFEWQRTSLSRSRGAFAR